MKTIAITIDESMLRSLDKIAGRGANRSRIVRAAIAEYLAREDKRRREVREQEIWERNHARIDRQARALVAEQGEP